MFIAEQQLVAAAVGIQVRGWVPFASTFAAFFSRAYDFVRMAAISRADIRLSGSHAGVSIGEDGPSQMALEDIASFRAIHGSTVLHPCDANQTAKLVAAMADREGISFLRTLRGKTPVRTPPDEAVAIGGSRVVRDGDDVAIVACGITRRRGGRGGRAARRRRHPARACSTAYSIKPIDADAVRAAARDCGAIVTVEDHWPEGGLGDAVLEALAEADDRPPVASSRCARCRRSGTPEELLHEAGIDAEAIAAAARGNAGPRGPGSLARSRPGGEARVAQQQGMIGRTHALQAQLPPHRGGGTPAARLRLAANGMSCRQLVPCAGSVERVHVRPRPRVDAVRAAARRPCGRRRASSAAARCRGRGRAAARRGTASPGRRWWRPRAASATSSATWNGPANASCRGPARARS